ncbi:MAG: MBL fold metallo-hydrolase [Alcanivorax sp.]|uniref:MBL fold metallo-hydrolase n=1 Tax=Alcanivorax sp. TaxID=1872427 RepID=UPI000C8E829B|nr:MBL fold metallo-hydrolase [Alcanivorax sp.]MAC14070.1 MBL fold metallo-hydrolase [Alcanivorax sp.]|tara:strand:- start:18804 stop:20507 length:1704 start_codon:yes stop_codon:yes gene_type:complete
MEVNFIGPLGKVTGSCTWMQDKEKGWNFLIDCGMQQGEVTADEWNHQTWPFDPSEIKFIVLTHAHMDHSGLIPSLYDSGFNGKVYCTEETAAIADIQYRNSTHLNPELFNQKNIDSIKWCHFKKEPILGSYHPVDNDLFIQFLRTGHILGAVSVGIFWGPPRSPEQRSIVFSGDIGPQSEEHEVLPTIRHFMNPGKHNYAVMESTYGSTNRTSTEKDPGTRRDHLKSLVDRTMSNQGTLIIPAFALGRSQDILFDLHAIAAEEPDQYERIDFYYDFPLGKEIIDRTAPFWSKTESNLKKTRPLWLGKQIFKLLGLTNNDPEHLQQAIRAMLSISLHQDDPDWAGLEGGNKIAANWKPIVANNPPSPDEVASSNRPTVIITGSGNGDAGKASSWLSKLLTKDTTTVAVTGYCGSKTVCGKLLSIKSLSIPNRRMSKNIIDWSNPDRSVAVADIRASIEEIKGYSAHGDQEDLLNWALRNAIDGYLPAGDTFFLQHGDNHNRNSLRTALYKKAQELGFNIDVQLPEATTGWISLESSESTHRDADLNLIMEMLNQRPELKDMIKEEEES